MKNSVLYSFLLSIVIFGCSSSDDTMEPANSGNSGNGQAEVWLIPQVEIHDGGPGKDGIPSIDTPKFVSANDDEIAYLSDSELIVGIVFGGVVRAYPHRILNWHESVNDQINSEKINISYCPLTGTAFGWKGMVNSENTTFGVSGLLYNANLILYDRKTDSNWSQLGLQCVNGKRIRDFPEVVQVIETAWGVWKQFYPNTQVMTEDTGFSRDYLLYPYGTYRTNHEYFIFPVNPLNNSLPSKERVFALIDKRRSKAYQFEKFENGLAIKEQFNGKDYLIVGTKEFIVGYLLEGDYVDLDYSYDLNLEGNVTIFTDNEGNSWSLNGFALSGPRAGQQLMPSTSVVSYWFAIAAFYPNPEIY